MIVPAGGQVLPEPGRRRLGKAAPHQQTCRGLKGCGMDRNHPHPVTQLLHFCYLLFTRQPCACSMVALSRFARGNGCRRNGKGTRTGTGKAVEGLAGM